MRIGLRIGVWTAGLTVALVVVTVVSATVGPVAIDVSTVAKASLNAVGIPAGLDVGISEASVLGLSMPAPVVDVHYTYPFSFGVPGTAETIVRQIRLPRIALGAVVGFALASAGAVMQGFFRNPMADPSIIGVSAGAAVGAVATIAVPVAVPFGLQGAAFVGALVAAFAVYAIATENGRTPVATLLLAGVAVQTFLGAVISYLLLEAGESLDRAVFWLMGHLHNSSWAEVEVTLPVAVVTFVGLFAYARDLNVLMLGEEDAQTVGIAVERTKRILLALSSVLTAAAVAVAGVIGFVGLIVPHVMRLLVGPDHRILLPTSALAGATFLVATDTVARSGPAELPVGIVTAALGAPFFLYLLGRREVHEL
ncbi:Cobalamin import system permease protein BtuC [Halorhabdus tiamatea SARL4B]|uniref:ABC-type vitamin B12 transporter, permease component BtuC n=1 Tax=Halorhabdus tiamatea SARL4B TaxID=1033806 RepID=F7PFG2_9EURY|nr:vitamin B12 ABC transporter permease BtuC [Halorhabdus tiamatea]ERJ06063.1 Cobalamin import system permease protein BtuC [Halorhabdus tiamatea SARL4B]CCQ34377.1 ABC-type vitamin B12 transporter, permease component BtuC [Halorhabdus tiamatea SARL4B]